MLAPSPLQQHQADISAGRLKLSQIADSVIAHANTNASCNTYSHFSAEGLRREAAAMEALPATVRNLPLFGVPASLKDCFDLRGTVTTAGTRYYAQHSPRAQKDSAVAERLHDLGCLITGKTHMHPLAYGITGTNPDFGDCLQPRDATLLTGGSSSGAAASVQEGSALFAIGTDTGGSIRVPAALCGLAGFRASHSMNLRGAGLWTGGIHLAPSFDTLGFLCADGRDLEPIAQALFRLAEPPAIGSPRIATVPTAFLADADSDVFESFAAWQDAITAAGFWITTFNVASWADPLDTYSPIQASESAAIHHGHFAEFEPVIAQRLAWGASLSADDLAAARARHVTFRQEMDSVFARYDFVIAPASPRSRLLAADDHSETRKAILRYTTPFSMGGNPVVVLPGEALGAPLGTGVQIAAAEGNDGALLAFATELLSLIAQTAS